MYKDSAARTKFGTAFRGTTKEKSLATDFERIFFAVSILFGGGGGRSGHWANVYGTTGKLHWCHITNISLVAFFCRFIIMFEILKVLLLLLLLANQALFYIPVLYLF